MQKGNRTLLQCLERLGDIERVKDRDAVQALERIYAVITGERVDLNPLYRHEDWEDFFYIRVHVSGFLNHAARIAEGKGESKRRAILKRAAERMKAKTADASSNLPRLEHAFIVKAVIPASGDAHDARLEISRPIEASPEFCVRYAMWLVALDLPVNRWRRWYLRKCKRKSCRKPFYDMKLMKGNGRPSEYCSRSCQRNRTK